jgi:hypothetical protein
MLDSPRKGLNYLEARIELRNTTNTGIDDVESGPERETGKLVGLAKCSEST